MEKNTKLMKSRINTIKILSDQALTLPDTAEFTLEFKVTKHFVTNHHFKRDNDKKIFVEEFLRKKKFVHYYPKLKVLNYYIERAKYGQDLLYVTFEISREEYIEHIYKEFMYNSLVE